jgi:hypothetical protein
LKRLGGDYARFVEESDYELSQVIGMIIIKKHETDGSAWIDQNKAGFLKKPAFWIWLDLFFFEKSAFWLVFTSHLP